MVVHQTQADKIRKAAETLADARYVVALTGAGVSVESGIPDFRGPDGLWTKYGEPPLDDYRRFLQDPKADWLRRLKREGYTKELHDTLDRAVPNPGHYALAEMERMGILKCLITQNIDNLDRIAGSRNIAEVHGNMTILRCIECGARYSRREISVETLPPRCPACSGIVKSDTVFFGEGIPPDVMQKCVSELRRCDCMLIAGTSAAVYPAAGFPKEVMLRGGCLLEVNLSETPLSEFCAVSVKGKTGEILPQLVRTIAELTDRR